MYICTATTEELNKHLAKVTMNYFVTWNGQCFCFQDTKTGENELMTDNYDEIEAYVNGFILAKSE